MHWNLSFQPRQFLQFWPFQIVFHPIDSTLQWLLPNLPGTNQKRSCPHKSSPEVLITEIHIYNIVKNKEHANAICNDKCYLQWQILSAMSIQCPFTELRSLLTLPDCGPHQRWLCFLVLLHHELFSTKTIKKKLLIWKVYWFMLHVTYKKSWPK